MSLLPNSIISENIPILNKDGTNNHDWWLFWYNIAEQVLGTSNSSAAAQLVQGTTDNEIDAQEDTIPLRGRVESLERQVSDPEVAPSISDVTRALMLAQDPLLPDPQVRAQPVSVVSVGSSPYTYQAFYDGTAVLNGGTVSAVSVSRDGTTFYATSVGSIPLSRLDYLKITYTGSPTLTFFPR